MEILLFSLRAVAPVVLIGSLGFGMRLGGLFDEDFVGQLSKVCFNVFFPIMLFNNLYLGLEDFSFNFRLKAFSVLAILFIGGVSWVLFPRIMKDRQIACINICHAIRTNFMIYAFPIIYSMFSDQGTALAAMMLPIAVIVFNVMIVITMSWFSQDGKGSSPRRLFFEVAKTPVILAVLIGTIFASTGLGVIVPEVVRVALSSSASIGQPMALIFLGAQINWASLRGNLSDVVSMSILRLVIIPAIFVPLAVLFGFRGAELGALFILFAGPGGVNTAIQARAYNIAPAYSAQVVAATTVMSVVTLFIGISILRWAALI